MKKINLKGKSFLKLLDFSSREVFYLLELSRHVKSEKRAGFFPKRLANKNIALLFEKTSTRTRAAFTVAAVDEGAHPEYLGKNDIQLGKKESVKDTARVLGRMFDGIEFRGFNQSTVEDLAKYSGVPVWNGLTNEYHPTQALADLLTVMEYYGTLSQKKMVYIGDGRNNVANSLMIGCALTGVDVTIIAPKSLWPQPELIEQAKNKAMNHWKVVVSEKVEDVQGADAVYTDVWVSMGEEDKPGIQERIKSLEPYQVNSKLMAKTGKDSIFLHCLPAHHQDGVHDLEVTEDVFESDTSLVFEQAENRLHTIKAIMIATLGNC